MLISRLLLSIVIRTTETMYSTVSMSVIRSVQERADEAEARMLASARRGAAEGMRSPPGPVQRDLITL